MRPAVCVYCSSSRHVAPVYQDAARELGRALAERGNPLVYGGGNIGLMGIVARACLEAGGYVVGVIPEALKARELALEEATELIVTRDMHERKATMMVRSDAFIALPGGFGTFEEICEVICHRQLGLHASPCILLNINGYWDPLVEQIHRGARERFIPEQQVALVAVADSVPRALDVLDNPPATDSMSVEEKLR